MFDTNIMTGGMMPEMNCARNAASYRVVVAAVELLACLLLAPEDLDDLVAGEHLLDVPVQRARWHAHWATNCGCERWVICLVMVDEPPGS